MLDEVFEKPIVAMTTPLQDGRILYDPFTDHYLNLQGQGCKTVLLLGTTGEGQYCVLMNA